MVLNFAIFLIFSIYIFKFFSTNMTEFCIYKRSLLFFLKLIISISCSVKDLQNFFMQSLPLHTSCLFSMLLNNDIVDTEKADGIFPPVSVKDGFSGLFYTHILNIQDLRKK